uniref:Tubulin polymerization promoting protein n=1 Tax=Lates calcarifer TaxID=8187 RepID=A0A4W6G7H0_LATCA
MEEIITRVAWKKGGWGRCGRVESKTTIHQTINLKDCTDDCQYHESGKYFWCHTEDGWDYCSSNPDHTYKDVTCRPNHKCGAYGQTYSWCYTTDNDDWDYCGLISTRECKCTPQHRTKRAPPRRQIERRGDQNGRQITFYNEGGQNNFAQSNRRLNDEARNLINQWDQQDLGTQGRTVITSDHLRIDLQGVITRGNQRYYNLQIQINVPRAGRSTTLSQIIVPFGTSAANMRWAFNYTLLICNVSQYSV